jgi:hypothetical protein
LSAWRVPSPLPGELAHSVIGRYLNSWRGLDAIGLLTQVAGFRPTWTHPACPPGVQRLARMSLPEEADPLRQFVAEHTLLPYFMAFEPQGIVSSCMVALRNDERACISRLLRPTALRIGAPLGLRVCVTCLDLDLRALGECYWHRMHQLPGVFHCPVHGDKLKYSDIPFTGDNAMRYETPDSHAIQSSLRDDELPFFDRRLERRIAPRSGRLLLDGKSEYRSGLVSTYRRTLMQFGFGGRKNELRTTAFEADLCKWLGRHKCDPARVGFGRWWLRLMTDIPGRSTPLQHLILAEYVREKTRLGLAESPDLFGF